ncbi:DUF397 domain-containing protein [Actinomadura sp. DC4]|uniref:DUF397 domain-containing protein n=1 Tax=Actinomadura sp. DC4 TaxID=3055069 RepID=UPI0025B08213|nr:DUF397 domain-containing protein [Actinomadura sp. DC4]MDN3357287.1 DUF397 domain-containing protein [Actinomadura sp. DC4]
MTQVPAESERVIAVRDSKDPDGPKLFFRPSAWVDLLDRIKSGEFELPAEFRDELDERFARPAADEA